MIDAYAPSDASSAFAAVRLGQARLLVVPTLRGMNLLPPVGGAAAAMTVAGLAGRHDGIAAGDVRLAARIVAILLALGCAFLLDDPAHQTVASSPATLMFRRGVRLAVFLPGIAAVWFGALTFLNIRAADPIGIGRPALELATFVAFLLAVSTMANRAAAEAMGGVVAGPAFLLALGVARILPPRFRFFDGGATESYAVGLRVTAVLVVSVAIAVWQSADAGRRMNRLGRLLRQSV